MKILLKSFSNSNKKKKDVEETDVSKEKRIRNRDITVPALSALGYVMGDSVDDYKNFVKNKNISGTKLTKITKNKLIGAGIGAGAGIAFNELEKRANRRRARIMMEESPKDAQRKIKNETGFIRAIPGLPVGAAVGVASKKLAGINNKKSALLGTGAGLVYSGTEYLLGRSNGEDLYKDDLPEIRKRKKNENPKK